MTVILVFFIASWYLSLFFQTFFLHRYAAHKSFTMGKFTERVVYVLTWIFQGSNYLSPYGYGVMHRMHHAYTDTDKDPHSPKYDSNMFKMMWHARNVSCSIYNQTMEIEPRFMKNLPDWKGLDRIGHSTWSRLGWIVVYFLFYLQFAPSAWFFLLLPIHILMVPIQGVIINWFAHKYGSVNFSMKNTSTNLFKVDILMMGEAYHNNHHKNPSHTNFGFRWHEIDPTYFFIRLLNRLRIIRIHKAVSVPATAPVQNNLKAVT